MKKQILPILVIMMMLTSCGNIINDTTTQTEDVITTTTNTTTETTAIPETERTWNYPPAVQSPYNANEEEWDDTVTWWGNTISSEDYQDTFESLMPVAGVLYGEKPLLNLGTKDSEVPKLIFFRVVARSEKESEPIELMQGGFTAGLTQYHIQIVDTYGDLEVDSDNVYRMTYAGGMKSQVYGRPSLEIGKIYCRLAWTTTEALAKYVDRIGFNVFQAGSIFEVKEIDGKRFLYSGAEDFSEMECAIPITDPEENNIYQTGKHDNAIAYLTAEGIPLPTYDYKCEVNAFYKEVEAYYN